jgi:hypothetical protein
MIADNQFILYISTIMGTKPSVEAVSIQSPIVEFRHRTVGVSDLAIISSIVTDVSFVKCRSKEWIEIGQQLATLPQLNTLSVDHCDSEDSLCGSICGSKSLRSVRMGKLCVIEKTAADLTKEYNNYAEFSSWLNCVSAAPLERPTATTTLSLLMGSKQCSKQSKISWSWLRCTCNFQMWRNSASVESVQIWCWT